MRKAIINGKLVDMDTLPAVSVSSQLRGWNLDDQRSIHAVDILQAHKRGQPSGEYIRTYPEEAQRQFTHQQIEEFGNSYE